MLNYTKFYYADISVMPCKRQIMDGEKRRFFNSDTYALVEMQPIEQS